MSPLPRHAILLSLLSLPLASTKSLWSRLPVSSFSTLIQNAYPIGNGHLAALPFGVPGREKWSFNLDSLWTGGPFENSGYRGGNPIEPKYQYLPGIRDWIWNNEAGNATALQGGDNDYGSFAVAGNLTVEIDGLKNWTGYRRELDLESAVHTVTFQAEGVGYNM
jgi:alpha-L-fucosidase 2